MQSKTSQKSANSTPSYKTMLGPVILVACCWIASLATINWPSKSLYLLAGVLLVLTFIVGCRKSRIITKAIVLLALVFPAWIVSDKLFNSFSTGNDAELISELVAVEERTLALTPQLKALSKGLMNLRLPDESRRSLFASSIALTDLADGNALAIDNTARNIQGDSLSIWGPLLEQVDWFEHARFYFVDGTFLNEGHATFEATVGFAGLAKLTTGKWQGLNGKLLITWQESEASSESESSDAPKGEAGTRWKISSWKTTEMSATKSQHRFFRETIEQALPRPLDRRMVRMSRHYDAAVEYYKNGQKDPPHPYFAPISVNQKPGLAIVDIDNDGDDDIYITVRIGQNMLLENQGDGTFIEAAAKYGINFHGHSTSALFADFDNDGDPDLVLGRSILPSLYFENVHGRFVHVPQAKKLPRLAISLSAADYNGDGLLDFYMLTYRPATIGNGASPSGGDSGQSTNWPDEFFDEAMAKEYYRRHKEANSNADPLFPNLLNQVGPPNVLFVNRGGGRFEPAKENEQLGIWSNSLQATWSDFDDDGDPDVYIANDWAPDRLFRNDGKAGFTDITQDSGATAFGFAMGVSWGDYDNDGLQDLYVSNMYSKAGHRITKRIKGLTGTYRESAAGNYLYKQNDDHSFKLVSGEKPLDIKVAKAGWSWGGQFADFNNDGFLDLYVLTGYFTAPKEVASEVDL